MKTCIPARHSHGRKKDWSGGIAIVSSVAGYSGLPQSLAYGPSKAAMINFCESLYYDCKQKNVAVHMINPGFVSTEATAKNDFEMPALITTEQAATEINCFNKLRTQYL